MSDISDKYKKLSQKEHVLQKPGMYIGETSPKTTFEWIYNKKINKMEKKEITYSPGLYKITDEIFVNALDETTRDKTVTQIKITINDDFISVYNNGKGIDVVIHPKHKIWVPELIFANLLTSTNYGIDDKRTTGGTHGLGAKLTAIFSKEMKIEIGDSKNKKEYEQIYKNNLSEISKPIVKKYSGKDGYVKITFRPDYEKFGYKKLDNDNKMIIEKRIYDIAALSPSYLKVYYNDNIIPVTNFVEYSKLYMNDNSKFINYTCGDKKWEIILTDSPNQIYEQISFVNGIYTSNGGNHTDYILQQIIDNVKKMIKNKEIKDSYIKDNIWLFINSTIINPSFSSQTKEELITSKKNFGLTCELSTSFFRKIKNNDIDLIENIKNYLKSKEMYKLAKSDGSKKSRLKNIPKLDDANYAGTSKSPECTIIFTEGDSAKAMAISGISGIKNGRNYYGIFPLKGKLLNVREATQKQLIDNAEINNIKKIIGLQLGKVYNEDNISSLRYGSILLMMDADVDGSHIKGLFLNFLDFYWPSLLKLDGYIKVLVTPVVKVTLPKENKVLSFKNLTVYNNWKNSISEGNFAKWNIKYYKGLGTSTSNEAKEYFNNINEYLLKITDNNSNKCITLAFSKKYADERKKWLAKYNINENIEFKVGLNISICDFVDKELIHFSNSDNIRSIPSLLDGLKPSQRKVIFGCFKRNLQNEIKVAQLAGYISEHSAYHHGENSLINTIINMAQNFMGSNNINLLQPIGQFGTRILGGKDHSSARYIFTNLDNITRLLFDKNDDPLFDQQNEDGIIIEPKTYLPILPLILINGTEGIGTGYSTNIPKYNPKDIIEYITKKLKGEKPSFNSSPWYKNFKGKIIKTDQSNYISQGVYIFDNKYLTITELPIGFWTHDYKEFLDDLIYRTKDKIFSSYIDNGTESNIKLILKINDNTKLISFDSKKDSVGLTDLSKYLKLNKTIKLTNMYLYDHKSTIKKYDSPKKIIDEYYEVRLEYYNKRKEYLLKKLNKELKILDSQVKFIKGLISNKIKISNLSKEKIIQVLKKEKFYLIENEQEYEYLIRMPIYSFSKEKISDLDLRYTNKNNQYNKLKKTNINDLWLYDLEKINTYMI